ncbi:DUF3726 domain-containing protein [Veronia pacifica]|uniref:DUF3726 domain-containing protein n=1 Tax=Veronia pacifica TaxID=1080227 RepID=A0A1C3ES88_9GAMM|nr:DUF3726 domain-containing protein [Veronia pacifica]ODA36058.1 hypothetical protein A8L45_00150 [Veronia pacifica]
MLTVTRNELISLCTKAFDATHCVCGESDAIATMVVDLEMAGQEGVTRFIQALELAKEDRDLPPQVTDKADNRVIVDCHGASIVCHLPSLVDYALERLADRPRIILELQRVHSRWLAFSELRKLAGKGLSVFAHWSGGEEGVEVECFLNAGQLFPDIYIDTSVESFSQSMKIIISKRSISAPVISEDIRYISSGSLAATYHAAFDMGITISSEDWQMLKSIAAMNLVEDSDISKQRAGD